MTFVTSIQKNKIFKTVASVKLAVPLMLILLVALAAGTFIESRYNAQIAAILLYRSPWFLVLLTLLWLNIFSAAFSRIPFKARHTGFVITHIGLMTLLAGAMLTALYGLDGELRIDEGSTENKVMESKLVLQVREVVSGKIWSVPIERKLKPYHPATVITENVSILRYEPFVAYGGSYIPSSIPLSGPLSIPLSGEKPSALRFSLKSAFFDFSDWLDTDGREELNLGPATIKFMTPEPSVKFTTQEPSVRQHLQVFSVITGKLLADIDVQKRKRIELGDLSVKIKKEFLFAVVRGGVLIDKAPDHKMNAKNPALELEIRKGKSRFKEYAFAAFPEFTVNPKETLGLEFHYEFGASNESNERNKSNEIIITPIQASNKVGITFMKQNKIVSKISAIQGETVETPWMDMKLTVDKYYQRALKIDVVNPIELPVREALPPSALKLTGVEGLNTFDGQWLVEGDYKAGFINDKKYDFYYGTKPVVLPFHIHLKKFEKSDYPGTAMAMNYKSHVGVSGMKNDVLIDMNNPLQHDGFYFYQASYLERPGFAPMTILSVNKDPGRSFKYIGSVILCLGIIIFTVMRSSWRRKNK